MGTATGPVINQAKTTNTRSITAVKKEKKGTAKRICNKIERIPSYHIATTMAIASFQSEKGSDVVGQRKETKLNYSSIFYGTS
jgi:hypothetical protein